MCLGSDAPYVKSNLICGLEKQASAAQINQRHVGLQSFTGGSHDSNYCCCVLLMLFPSSAVNVLGFLGSQ